MAGDLKKDTENQEWKSQAVKVLGDLSHSLRNPFSTIQSYINILEMEEYTFSPEELQQLTLSLQDTIDKSMKLIDEKISILRESLISH